MLFEGEIDIFSLGESDNCCGYVFLVNSEPSGNLTVIKIFYERLDLLGFAACFSDRDNVANLDHHRRDIYLLAVMRK